MSSNAVWLRTSEFRPEHPLEIDRTRDCENGNRVVGCAAEGVGDDTTGCSNGTLGGNIFTTGGTVGCKMGAPETVDLIDGLKEGRVVSTVDGAKVGEKNGFKGGAGDRVVNDTTVGLVDDITEGCMLDTAAVAAAVDLMVG